MSSVISTDTDCIQLQRLVVQHFSVASVALDIHVISCKKSFRLAFHQVSACDHFHIRLL